jgi:hypothetical protein
MTRYLTPLAILGICCSVGFSQSPAETELYEKLCKEGPDSVAALEAVLTNPEEHSAFILFQAALVAFGEKRLEDSGFLFYAGQLRADFDRVCFPPKGTGGDDPFLPITVMEYFLGDCINPAVMAEPKAFRECVARLKVWTPRAPEHYHPGYDFTERKPEEEAHEAVKAARAKFIAGMAGLATLLNDQAYFAAFQVVQAYNLGLGDKRPTKEAYEKAVGTMKRIEEERGIEGFAALQRPKRDEAEVSDCTSPRYPASGRRMRPRRHAWTRHLARCCRGRVARSHHAKRWGSILTERKMPARGCAARTHATLPLASRFD